ncbi:MAG: peptide ABC transporter substrate-binding protein [Nevskiaceae bacterium]|jgi:oligopeptide transport system substrate-binding protein|nr:peptide ABC transporter substrate-binding protein [Nevskiaceae bacterium]
MRWNLLIGLFLLPLLCACSGGESRVVSGNREGILHMGNGTEPQELDPHAVTGVPEHNILLALFEGLVGKDPVTLAPVPGVAERWEISEDGRTYTFHLRHDAKWSNGDALTAEDFRWSWWRGLQPTLGNEYAYMLYPIKNAENYVTGKLDDFSQVGVKVLDDYTLEVQLNEPTTYFLQLLDHQSYFPVPRKILEQFGGVSARFSKWTRPGNMVSNGPFRLKEWKLYDRVAVEKNPHYWDAANVKLNGIVFYPTENTSTEERMFRSGQLHMTSSIPLDKIPAYRANHPDALRMNPYLGSYYFEVNITRPGLDDVRVRRALAMTVDRDTLINTVLQGVNFPAYAITPPGTSGYQPPQLFKFDPEGARKLLAEAGYPDGKGFPKIEILYNTNEGHRKIAVALQQMWKQYLNIDVGMVNQEWKVYLDNRDTHNYDIARAGWIGDYVDPNTFVGMWITGGGNNHTGWSNAQFDDLVLRRIPAMQTEEETLAGFHEAETILMESMPIIPVYTYSTKYLLDPAVKGLSANIMDFYSFKNVWLEPR